MQYILKLDNNISLDNYIKDIAKGNMSDKYTPGWLSNVSSTGDFYTPTSTNWTSGLNGIPTGWTRHSA